MRIAVVSPRYGLMGGAEGFAYELTERLSQEEDFEIHVLAHRWRVGSNRVRFHKIPMIRFPRSLRQILLAHVVERRLSARSYALVHSHERVFSADLLTMHGLPHGLWVNRARGKRMSLYDRSVSWVEGRMFSSGRLGLVLPVSTLVKEAIQEAYGLEEKRIQVLHPGVDLGRFGQWDPHACRKEIRARYGFSKDHVVMLFVGMNFEIKRLGRVLEAMALLGKEGERYRLLVVGRGDRRPYLKEAQRAGIGQHVVFTGVIERPEQHFLASDLFVMPSRFDTFGMAVLEAMAASLPVVITRNVGARDLVQTGVHGVVLGEDPSAQELGQGLALLGDRDRRIAMGRQARKVAEHHTWDRVAKEMASIYRATLRQGSRVQA